MILNRRIKVAIVGVLAILAAALFISPAAADAGLDPVAVAQVQMANCQVLAAHTATGTAQHTRAVQCVADQKAIIALLAPATPSPSLTGTPTATPTALPSPTAPPATTPPATTTPPASPTPTPTVTGPVGLAFPNATAGVPAGWIPTQIRTTDLVVTTPGAVVQDVELINASIILRAPGVTIRRVELDGGYIDTSGVDSACSGHLIQDVTITRGPGEVTTYAAGPVIGPGGYTAVNVRIDGLPEGMRVGEKDHCGPVVVRDSYVNVQIPDNCAGDWHGDGIQGYLGAGLTVRHSTFRMVGVSQSCDGTSPFFWPAQGNGPLDLDGALVIGGLWYAFRDGTVGTVAHAYVVGEVDAKCSLAGARWDVRRATATADMVVTPGVAIPCTMEGGN